LSGARWNAVEPENALENALVAAAADPAARPLFYRLLGESPLLMLDASSEPPVRDQETVLEAGKTLQAVCVPIDGVLHTAIFSSLTLLRQHIDSEHKYISMMGRDLLTLMRGSHLILNPGAAYGKQILPDEIEAILSGAAERGYVSRVVEADTRVLLGQPAKYPHHITDALAFLFRSRKEVRRAYLALCAWPDTGEQHLIIGLDATGDWDILMRDITSMLQKAARPNEIVDIIRMDDSAVSDYLQGTRPFYRRKLFGLF